MALAGVSFQKGVSPWASGEPSGHDDEKCLQIRDTGKWNDENCGFRGVISNRLQRYDCETGWRCNGCTTTACGHGQYRVPCGPSADTGCSACAAHTYGKRRTRTGGRGAPRRALRCGGGAARQQCQVRLCKLQPRHLLAGECGRVQWVPGQLLEQRWLEQLQLQCGLPGRGQHVHAVRRGPVLGVWWRLHRVRAWPNAIRRLSREWRR